MERHGKQATGIPLVAQGRQGHALHLFSGKYRLDTDFPVSYRLP